MNGPLTGLARLSNARSCRISSYDRSGGNADKIVIGPRETVSIATINGPGVIRHIWVTMEHADPMHRRAMVLRMYWDGNAFPSVECPIGDFFGQGWGERYNYVSLPLCAAPRDGHALISYFPMPFADGARIEIENESDQPCASFYYYVDYDELDAPARDEGRFHAQWVRSLHQPPCGVESQLDSRRVWPPNLTDKFNHVFLNTRGRGHFVGLNYYTDSPTPLWYGEGDDMFFIDGEEWPPSLHGTGTEDYFNTAWGPKEPYLHPYFGAPRVNGETDWFGRTHVFRFHLEDPVHFKKELRASIEIGHANCLAADVVTVAYWYQEKCVRAKKIPPVAKRMNMPKITALDIHYWRETYRWAHGGKAVWGTEGLPEQVKKECDRRLRAMQQSTGQSRGQAEHELKKQAAMLNPRKKK